MRRQVPKDSMNKKKVMIFSSSFLPKAGGLQYELKWFLDSLDIWVADQDELEFVFVSPGKSSLEFIDYQHIETFDLDFDEFRSRGIRTTGRTILNLRKILRQTRPDVVHCHGILPDAGWVYLASLGLRKRPKIVVTSHGADIVQFPEFEYGARRNPRANRIIRFFSKRIVTHVLPSAALERFSGEIGVEQARRIVIPNGLPVGDEPDFEYVDGQSESGVVSFNQNDIDGLRFLSLSSGRPIKNLSVLVRAFAVARPDLGDSRLLLACVGSSADHIHELVEDLGLVDVVDFIGEVRGLEKRNIFMSSDVYCQVSHFENSPVSLLESMKFGAAVIASDVGGVPEMIQHEHNGLLVDQNDVSSVAGALARMVKDRALRESLVETGGDIIQNYSMYRTIERYVGVYRATN